MINAALSGPGLRVDVYRQLRERSARSQPAIQLRAFGTSELRSFRASCATKSRGLLARGFEFRDSIFSAAASFPRGQAGIDIETVDAAIGVDIRRGIACFPCCEEGVDVGAVHAAILIEISRTAR